MKYQSFKHVMDELREMRAELDELYDFIESGLSVDGLDEAEQYLLMRQVKAMALLCEILEERIAGFDEQA